jgi:hypothetical protein
LYFSGTLTIGGITFDYLRPVKNQQPGIVWNKINNEKEAA